MTILELSYTPATALAARIRQKEISPVEVVSNCLERIDEVNPTLNCFCFVFADEAMDSARTAEAAVMRGDPLGPLHGVPVAFKDFTPTRGKRTTLGSYAFEDWVPNHDALVVERLQAAGAIMVGKTTTPEFAHSAFTRSPLWGVTRNPWDTRKTPGGSSGGSAAAVATGCVPLAEGTDMGGSVRIPASLCGIVGLKPSLGRIPMDILPTVFDTISHFGPLSRTIADAALFLSAASGPSDRDIMSLNSETAFDVPPPSDVAGLRFALSIDLGYMAIDPQIEARIRDAAGALVEAGAVVDEIDLGWTRHASTDWIRYWEVYLAAFFADKLETHRERLDPNVVALMEAGLKMDAVSFKRLEIARSERWLRLADVFREHDALLCPTMAVPAPDAGRSDSDFDWIDEEGRYHGMDLTCPFNYVSQCPALSVPAGFTSDGLPVGLQIVANRFDDPLALRVGAALEAVRPWAGRRPAL